MSQPLMPKAVAVWLVDNTSLTFDQIAAFVGLHPLEVSGIADGEVAQGMKGRDPVAAGELTRGSIEECEKDPKKRLRLVERKALPPQKRKAPRYTPLSKRQERPAAIAWLVRNHPELSDGQISKLVGTTKPTIQSIRERTHWNISQIQPIDPVALGMCRQMELDEAVKKAAKKAGITETAAPEEGALLTTEESLAAPEPEAPKEMTADELFNLPKGDVAEDEETR
jgi:hypothetical protein